MKRRWLYLAGALAVIAAGALVLWMAHGKRAAARREARAREREVRAGPRVPVVRVGRSAPSVELRLPGEVRPFAQVTLYAKVAGYVGALHVDVGDRVRAGETVAVVTSPETDRQYAQAVADARNKRDVARRYQALYRRKLVSTQDAEQFTATARIAEEEARLQRTLRGYQVLRALFYGVVVARYVDPGALVQDAAVSATGSQPVVQIAEDRTLRVFAYVDQRDAGRVRPGDRATVVFPQHGEEPATLTRVAGALYTATRMLLIEIEMPNPGVVAGGRVEVRLRVARPSLPLVPSQALVLRGRQPFVAVVGDDARVHFRKVELAADDGEQALLRSGVTVGERVAIALGDRVVEGAHVQPVEKK